MTHPRRTSPARAGRHRGCPRSAEESWYSSVSSVLGQLRSYHPDVVDALDQTLESVQLNRLAQIAVRPQLVALHDVRLRLGGRQDDGRYGLQIVVGLDLSQHLPAVHLGKIQIQQDQ